VGSNPIARSGLSVNGWHLGSMRAIKCQPKCFIPGDVAKWQGKGLQNPHHGFKSHRRLKQKDQLIAGLFCFPAFFSNFNL
jgi:hypothetical protein